MGFNGVKDIKTRADYEVEELEKHRTRRRSDRNQYDYDDSTGYVSCPKLKIREQPDANSNVLYILSEGDIVYIEQIPNNKDWVSVFTVVGINGYCLKKFISKMGD